MKKIWKVGLFFASVLAMTNYLLKLAIGPNPAKAAEEMDS